MSRIALTIDVESDWGGRVGSTVAIDRTLGPILELFDELGSKATFFVSSEIAGSIREPLQRIVAEGHEVASHGHAHNLRYDQFDRDALRHQIAQSKSILEDLTGVEVCGFRTPQFRKNAFTEEVLLELGFSYDSSSVEVSMPGRYVRNAHVGGRIREFPVSSIYGRLPAGIKWLNLFRGSARASVQDVSIIYVHLFDLLSMRETLALYGQKVSINVLVFYLARLGSTFGTFGKYCQGSVSLNSLV